MCEILFLLPNLIAIICYTVNIHLEKGLMRCETKRAIWWDLYNKHISIFCNKHMSTIFRTVIGDPFDRKFISSWLKFCKIYIWCYCYSNDPNKMQIYICRDTCAKACPDGIIILEVRAKYFFKIWVMSSCTLCKLGSTSIMIGSQIAKFMGPTWGPPGSCRPQMGSMLAPWALLSGIVGVIFSLVLRTEYFGRSCGLGPGSI